MTRVLKVTLIIFLLILPDLTGAKYVIRSPSNQNELDGLTCNKQNLKSGPYKINLIELYSSEACANCPPADNWMNNLIDHRGLWTDIIPLKFHVDYFNSYGWKDTFAQRAFSKRQYAYAQEWHFPVVYTPEIIYNGEQWAAGEPPPQNFKKKEKSGYMSVRKRDDVRYSVSFSPLKKILKQVNIYGALVGHGYENKIKFGENVGMLLKHNFIVLDLQQITVKSNSGHFFGKINFKLPKRKAQKYSVVFWVSSVESMKHLQAVGGCANL